MKKAWKDLVLFSTGLAALLVISLTSMALMVILGIGLAIAKIMTIIR